MQDRDSRFVVASATGPLSEDLIEQAVTTTVARTHQRELHWFSDGWQGYQNILVRAYPPAQVDRQAWSAGVGGPCEGHVDENGQAS